MFARVPLLCPRGVPRAQLLADGGCRKRAQVIDQPLALCQEMCRVVRVVLDHLHEQRNVHALVEGGVQVGAMGRERFELGGEFEQQRAQLVGVTLVQPPFEIVSERLVNRLFHRAELRG